MTRTDNRTSTVPPCRLVSTAEPVPAECGDVKDQVGLQNLAARQTRPEGIGDRALAAAARPGDHEERQQRKRSDLAAARATQHALFRHSDQLRLRATSHAEQHSENGRRARSHFLACNCRPGACRFASFTQFGVADLCATISPWNGKS
jgi:hypothetical protein